MLRGTRIGSHFGATRFHLIIVEANKSHARPTTNGIVRWDRHVALGLYPCRAL